MKIKLSEEDVNYINDIYNEAKAELKAKLKISLNIARNKILELSTADDSNYDYDKALSNILIKRYINDIELTTLEAKVKALKEILDIVNNSKEKSIVYNENDLSVEDII